MAKPETVEFTNAEPSMTREEAIQSVTETDGVSYQSLPEKWQRDEEVARIATVTSAGSAFIRRRVSQDVRDSFGPDWYACVLREGAQPWIVEHTTRTDVKESPEVNEEITRLSEEHRAHLQEVGVNV